MARYTEARCRLCRREGVKLFLKGTRCSTEKCNFVRRPTPPGQHTRVSRKPSYYALQLREKQKVKRIYGLLERQFRKFFQEATKSRGVTGKTLMQMLERRLDNVVFKALFGQSRVQSRQFVNHGLTFVNGGRVDIPSYQVQVGDVVTITAADKTKEFIKKNIESVKKERSVPHWLAVDADKLTITVTSLPQREDVNFAVNEQLIVELYSK